jgi:hippurate hydrolase
MTRWNTFIYKLILFLLFGVGNNILIANTDPINGTSIAASIEEKLPFLVNFYKELHQNPEVSLQEQETSAKLAKELEQLGFEVTTHFGGYGLVAILKNGEGPTVLYRTDMDALPMPEKTNLSYASQKTITMDGIESGIMHSCGHDMHMTNWIGTAMVMSERRSEWSGTLMLIGQPAEEIGAGAKLMLDQGLYSTFGVPDFGFALHCNPTIPAGQIGVGAGYTMANAEIVDIAIKGVGAHGASPHMAVDPIVLASMMIMDIQTIVSRNVKPIESAVITVGAIKGGTKHNIIPDEVSLKITVRTFKDEVRLMIRKRINEIARGVAIAAGLPESLMPVVTYNESYTPANLNYPEMVDKLKSAAGKVIGETNVVEAEPQLVAEDFARYGQTEDRVPTVLYWLGTVPKERLEAETLPGLHSPFYYPAPEKSIQTGVGVSTQLLFDLFNP